MNKTYFTKKWEEKIIHACQNNSSMRSACASLNMHFNTFKKHAQRLGVYKTNQSGKGLNKGGNGNKTPMDEILQGLHPQYQTNKLRLRLLRDGIKEHQCEQCKLKVWNDLPIPLELDHINGISNDHRTENIRLLCPNCHAQTSTFRGKNIKNL